MKHKNMSSPLAGISPEEQGYALFFGLVLVAIYMLYQFGFAADWLFDDWLSLNGLDKVVDFDSSITYVLGNGTGPTGRPVTMLSFLLNVDDWNQYPEGFRQINTFIHLFNVFFVALAAWQIARVVPSLRKNAAGFAVMLALIWGLHPLFASAVLSVVQRMALLSASFVLLGINGYLYGRSKLPKKPALGMVIMLGSLGVGLLLATFSKENGALLPVFLGLLELQILSRYFPIKLSLWRAFSLMLLWGPIFLYLAYVAISWQTIVGAQESAYRAFSWSQRLWSELLILWEYVRQLFVPDIMTMGPIQNDVSRIHGMDYFTLVALLVWGVIGVLAWRMRKRFPVLLFGIGFFLAGHMVESSFVQLELYFEHRNYIPAIGLFAIPVTGVYLGKQVFPKVLVWVVVLPLLAFLLYMTTNVWGDPELSSERWYEYHPTSLRAIQKRMLILEEIEGEVVAADFVASVSDRMPRQLDVAAYALSLECKTGNEVVGIRLLERIEALSNVSNPLRGTLGFPGFLGDIVLNRIKYKCSWLPYDRLESLLSHFLKDPSIKMHPSDLSRLYVTLSRVDFASGNIQKGLEHIHQGYLLHQSYTLFGIYSRLLRNLGQDAKAETLKAEFLSTLPSGISSMNEHKRRVQEAYNAPG
jgi:hypothetical protein